MKSDRWPAIISIPVILTAALASWQAVLSLVDVPFDIDIRPFYDLDGD
jgi:hypothetical protein